MNMMASVFLSAVRNNVKIGKRQDDKALCRSAHKADVLGTEAMKEVFIQALSRQAGNASV